MKKMFGRKVEEEIRNICGDFNIKIDKNGTWYYQGTPIRRKSLIKLFSSILTKDNKGVYWLTTPYERGTIEVDDVPFIVVEMKNRGVGTLQEIDFMTNIDSQIPLGPKYELWLESKANVGRDLPYIDTGKGLFARLSRNIFYQLIDLGEVIEGHNESCLRIWSRGKSFRLGSF